MAGYGNGQDLENSSIGWVDSLTNLGDGTKKQTNATLVAATEQLLDQLRGAYQKAIDTEGRSNAWTAQQLTSRIENTLELLPAAQRKRLNGIYERDLAAAQEMGRKAGLDLDKRLKEKQSEALSRNARPNLDAMKAAGRRLETFWNDENRAFTDRVKALTRNALAQGMSWKQLSKQVRELLLLDPNQSQRGQQKNKRMGIPGRADLIARTELATAFIQGQLDNYRRLGYEHVRWSAAAERTCGFCMSRDGLVYLLEEIEGAIPAHPRCRCSLIPVEADSLKKPKGPTGPDAASQLDDAYWTKSRNDKLAQWKQENRGIRDPKTEQILNNMLRDYARTPTNTERYLKPGQEAVAPKWAPSGDIIPSLGKAESNAKKAEEKAKKQAEKAAMEKAAQEAKDAELAEQARLAKVEAKEAKEAEVAALKAETKKKKAEAAATKKKAEALSDAQAVIKFLSMQALNGTKLTATQMKSLKTAQATRDRLLAEAGKGPKKEPEVIKAPKTTDDIFYNYGSSSWKELGYSSVTEMNKALKAIRDYTDNGYGAIMGGQLVDGMKTRNMTTWERNKAERLNEKWIDAQKKGTLETANTLEDFVRRAPKYEGFVQRGLHLNSQKDAQAFIKNLAKGDPSNSLESWTNDYEVAEQFATGRPGLTGVVLNVRNRSGAPIANASEFASESEVLVPKDQRYRVRNVTKRLVKDIKINGKTQVVFDVDLEILDD